jgi:hypothetical protein
MLLLPTDTRQEIEGMSMNRRGMQIQKISDIMEEFDESEFIQLHNLEANKKDFIKLRLEIA